MKIIELTKHQDYIYSLFESSFEGEAKVIGWQTLGGEKISRIVFQLKVSEIEGEQINLSSFKGKEFDFKPGYIYIFSAKPFYICRTKIVKQENGFLTIELPEVIKTDKDVIDKIKEINEKVLLFKESKVSKSPKERDGVAYVKRVNEDEEFAAMRTAPRMKTKEGQKCTVKFVSRNKENKEYGLNDLSRGGAGILVNNSEAFKKGDIIQIVAIDGNSVPPMEGEVMSVRMHDVEKKLFKAGIRFVQDEEEKPEA